MHKIENKYNPKDFEEKIYDNWESKGYFKPSMDKNAKPYCIVMPPPNVTGKLHMGHALDGTLQDLLIRYKRMKGFNTLWLPGTDHAAISTEVKVVEKLKKEGKKKSDLSREEFIEEAWDWTRIYGGEIINQQKKLGCSCDWSRKRFTMDEGLSNAVYEAFKRLYEKGYIYKGNRMINYCTGCHSSISDAEIEYIEEGTHLWYIKYPIKDEDGKYLVVATTRPETMLGDTAVAVNPGDKRYKELIGKKCVLPIINKEIPIIGDRFVETEFGTGAVKITPCHDMNDYQAGLDNNLEMIEVFDENLKMLNLVAEWEGLDIYEARVKIVEKLKDLDAIEKIEDYTHNVAKCDRCHSVIEPRISDQWFVKMGELAKPAIDAVKNGDIKFVPERYSKTFYNWMENIKDWCISRQIWWGHQVPIYYCEECGEKIVAKEMPSKCTKCNCTELVQDTDTLDTWFSSALWPFSTLGWPNENAIDLKTFYPTNTLVTGYDIIQTWVSRMIFSGLEYMGEKPFDNVLIHGIVRDSQGRKMSKSLGNGIDPLEVKEQYSTDILRYSLVTGISAGNDIRYSPEKLEFASSFINKLWNASKFVLNAIDNQNNNNNENYDNKENQDNNENYDNKENQDNNENYDNKENQDNKEKFDMSNINEKNITELDEKEKLYKIINNVKENVKLVDKINNIKIEDLQYEDKWILSKLNSLIKETEINIDNFDFGVYVQKVYDFVWNEFCDWYIEIVKPRLYNEKCQTRTSAEYTLNKVLCESLKLLHPVIPFVTEEIYLSLYNNDESIMISKWPEYNEKFNFSNEENQIEKLKEIITEIRNIRNKMNVHPTKKSKLIFVTNKYKNLLEKCEGFLLKLGFADKLEIFEAKDNIPQNAIAIVQKDLELFIPFEDLVDFAAEKERLILEKNKLESEVNRARKMLSNPGFVNKAPESKIAEEKEKLSSYEEMLNSVNERLKNM